MAGAFHPPGFKALGEPQGRAVAAPREQGESERRQPPDSHGCWGLSLMFGKALERRMKGAGGVGGSRAAAGLQPSAQALAATRGARDFPDLLSSLPPHRLCPLLWGRQEWPQGKPRVQPLLQQRG